MIMFFFFKQKTAYEMRISDWSSDVCSSDLLFEMLSVLDAHDDRAFLLGLGAVEIGDAIDEREDMAVASGEALPSGKEFERLALRIGAAATIGVVEEIGRASCRERVGQYV